MPFRDPDGRRLALRVVLLTAASALFGVIVNWGPLVAGIQQVVESAFPGLDRGEAAYIAFIARTLLFGLGTMVLVVAVVALERPTNVRAFFKLGPIDWPGIGLLFVLLAFLNALEILVLGRFVYAPLGRWIASLGLPPTFVAPPLTPDPQLAGLNLALLLLVIWVEAPEEIFFRGYVQNRLQRFMGVNGALLAAAVLWDAWHAFDPPGFPRRLLFGVGLGLVFRVRQNTTPLAIGHPLANRLLLAGYIALPLFRSG